MRKRFVYDVETDGFLAVLTTIHSLVMWDLDTQELLSYRNDGNPENIAALEAAVRVLDAADLRVAHNGIGFDEPALAKVYPFFRTNREGVVFDTLVACRLVWPNIADSDKGRVQRGTLPGKLIGSQSLEAWGCRLGSWKGDYSKQREAMLKAINPDHTPEELSNFVWGTWNQQMQDYCDQDVRVNATLYGHIMKKAYPQRAFDDEMAMAGLCQRIEANGFTFDEAKAGALYGTLAGERTRLEEKLKETFGSWVEPSGEAKTPSVSNTTQGYWGDTKWVFLDDGSELGPEDFTPKGLPKGSAKDRGVRRVFTGYSYTPAKIIDFNPTSRHHIANRLKKLYGWEPQEFTQSGEPKLDETTMADLPYPEAKLLVEYFTITKRIGQIAEGKMAWLKLAKNGRIHGRYNSVGAVTRRATHSTPNIAQVPSTNAPYGKECRDLFSAPAGWYLAGTDASGLELRCLAHFLARYDDGEYAKIVVEGDVHTRNQEAAGLPTRNAAKTWTYAFLYGAGDSKLGDGDAAKGKALREKFLTGLPAMGKLVAAVKQKAKAHKSLNSLDGGPLHVRSDHAALNTLLQSAGSLLCKSWLLNIERELTARGYNHGADYQFAAWVHDEAQIACRTKELAEEIAEVSTKAMKQAEAYYNFRCPLAAETRVGRTWLDTH